MSVQITVSSIPEISQGLIDLLPEQGSLEVQHDQPGKTHHWHRHSVTEELFILRGSVLLFWMEGDKYMEKQCPAGTWITLNADTTHGSTAGESGAMYLIRPQDGQAAQTVFLDAEDYPLVNASK